MRELVLRTTCSYCLLKISLEFYNLHESNITHVVIAHRTNTYTTLVIIPIPTWRRSFVSIAGIVEELEWWTQAEEVASRAGGGWASDRRHFLEGKQRDGR